jgi:hypothetical protein
MVNFMGAILDSCDTFLDNGDSIRYNTEENYDDNRSSIIFAPAL